MPYSTYTRALAARLIINFFWEPPGWNAAWHHVSFYGVQVKLRTWKHGQKLKTETPKWQTTHWWSLIHHWTAIERKKQLLRQGLKMAKLWDTAAAPARKSNIPQCCTVHSDTVQWWTKSSQETESSYKRRNQIFRREEKDNPRISCTFPHPQLLSLITLTLGDPDHEVLCWVQCIVYSQLI